MEVESSFGGLDGQMGGAPDRHAHGGGASMRGPDGQTGVAPGQRAHDGNASRRDLDSQTGGGTMDGAPAVTTTVRGATTRVSGSSTIACASLHNRKRK
jgi:hypothetical protein